MSSHNSRRWTADPQAERLSTGWTFSLGTLFRAITLLCVALGWLALVRFARPESVLAVLVAIVAVKAAIVGFRRRASRPSRLLAALLFFGLGLFIAVYSALAAWVVQMPVDESVDRFAGLTQLVLGSALLAVVPAAIAALVFMAQAWMWSAYDQHLHTND